LPTQRATEEKKGSVKAAIYCRVSTTMQEDNYSLPTQEEACRKHAAALGYTVTAVQQDVHSGYELWERRGLTALREAARSGRTTRSLPMSLIASHAARFILPC
jgi:DNA invertase Pin-like site-specific DNA recombinase